MRKVLIYKCKYRYWKGSLIICWFIKIEIGSFLLVFMSFRSLGYWLVYIVKFEFFLVEGLKGLLKCSDLLW